MVPEKVRETQMRVESTEVREREEYADAVEDRRRTDCIKG